MYVVAIHIGAIFFITRGMKIFLEKKYWMDKCNIIDKADEIMASEFKIGHVKVTSLYIWLCS